MSNLTRFKKASESNSGSNVFDKPSYKDEFIFDKKSDLKTGEALVFRFINLADDFVMELNGFRASVMNTKTNNIMQNIHIVAPNDPDDLHGILDDAGNDLHDLYEDRSKYSSLKLIPVYLMFKLNEDREIVEEYGRLGYLEFPYSMEVSYQDMKSDVDAESDFESDLPPYSVMLTKSPTGNKGGPQVQYDLKMFSKYKENGKSKKDPTFGIEDIEEAVGAEEWNRVIEEESENLMEFLENRVKDEMKVDSIRNRFARYRKASSKGSSKSSEVESTDDDDAPTPDDELDKALNGEDEPEEKPKSSGRRWGKKGAKE